MDVFISYKSDDRLLVSPIVQSLKSHGFDTWWDRDIPYGAPWEQSVENALNSAKCVVVFWTQRSTDALEGARVQVEARNAQNNGKLIQVLLEAVSPPLFFQQNQAADLMDWHGDTSHPNWSKLIQAISGILRGEAPAASHSPNAPTSIFLMHPEWTGPRVRPPNTDERWDTHRVFERDRHLFSGLGIGQRSTFGRIKWSAYGELIALINKRDSYEKSCNDTFAWFSPKNGNRVGTIETNDAFTQPVTAFYLPHSGRSDEIIIIGNKIETWVSNHGRWSTSSSFEELPVISEDHALDGSKKNDLLALAYYDLTSTTTKPPRWLKVWNVWHQHCVCEVGPLPDEDRYTPISFAPSSSRVLVTPARRGSGWQDQYKAYCRYVDIESGKLETIDAEKGWQFGPAVWHPTRDVLAVPAVTQDLRGHRVVLLDAVGKKLLGEQDIDHRGGVSAIDWSADGRFIATGGEDETVCVWDLKNGEIKTLFGHSCRVERVEFSPDGQRLATCNFAGKHEVIIWDPNTGEQLTRFNGDVSPMIFPSTIWSPDASMIASQNFATGNINVRRLVSS